MNGFALKGGSVDIKYNSGYVESDVPFERLADFGIDLTFVKKEDGTETEIGTVKNNTLLTVSKYNGAFIKLYNKMIRLKQPMICKRLILLIV